MKVLSIFPRFEGPYGGERLEMRLLRGLAALGHQVTLLCVSCSSDVQKSLQSAGITVRMLTTWKFRSHRSNTLISIALMPFIAFFIPTKPDVIHSVGWQSVVGAAFVRILRPSLRQCPVVYHCLEPPRFVLDLRDLSFVDSWGPARMLNHLLSPLVWIVYDLAVRSSDLVISISDRVAEWNMGLHGLESTVIYPGIEVERFDRVDRNAARAHLGLPEDAVVFVSVSKLHPRKRIDLALKLFEQHPSSETRSAVFLIVGDGPDRGRLERLVTSLQLTNVKFLGEVPDELIRMLYAAADYFIFTALDEPFGLAPLEAKVAGCKILGIESNYPIISWEESTRRVARCLERLLDR